MQQKPWMSSASIVRVLKFFTPRRIKSEWAFYAPSIVFTIFVNFSCHLLNKIFMFHKYLVEIQIVKKNHPSENVSLYYCGGGHGGYAISSSMQMLNRSYNKGGSLKWKSLLEHQIRKSRLLQRLFNNRFLRERGMASNPKMEYQIFLCIFLKNSAMAT